MTEPTTGFEDSVAADGHEWTTYAEGESFLAAVAALSDRMTVESLGDSVEDRSMTLVRVGTGPRHVFILAQIHGWEVAGREASFQFLRDLALTEDAGVIAHLAEVTWLFMPTGNPDKIGTQRENANNADLNRDGVKLLQPEMRAVATVVRDLAPEMVLDLHEGRNITQSTATSPTLNPNADAAINTLSVSLESAVKAAFSAAGYTHEQYQGNNIVGPEYAHNNASLRHAVSVLVETRRTDTPNSPTRVSRVERQLAALGAVWDYYVANEATFESTCAASRSNAISRGVAKSPAFELIVGTDSSGPELDPPPAGYSLDGSQFTATSTVRSLLGITSRLVEGEQYATMGQSAQPLIPYVMDASSPEKTVSATAVTNEPPVPVGLVNARNGTLTAVGGTLTAA